MLSDLYAVFFCHLGNLFHCLSKRSDLLAHELDLNGRTLLSIISNFPVSHHKLDLVCLAYVDAFVEGLGVEEMTRHVYVHEAIDPFETLVLQLKLLLLLLRLFVDLSKFRNVFEIRSQLALASYDGVVDFSG